MTNSDKLTLGGQNNKDLLMLGDKEIVVFTDGSSRGNPGPGGYGAVALYYNAFGEMMVDEIGGREALTTNNRMELKAVLEGMKNFINYYQDLSEYTFRFYIDSSYVVNGITKWLKNWQRNNWISSTKEEVKNKDLWLEMAELLKQGDGKGPINFKLNLVAGHAGIAGNERCDVIATTFADNEPISLYTGTITGYPNQDILSIEAQTMEKREKSKSKKSSNKGTAYSYVSMVDGQVHADKTWAECEKRVKGKKGARFKKVFSSQEENEFIKELKSL
jgi:ribonuclease HI